MAPQTKYEIILVNLKFSANIDPEFPEFKHNSERGIAFDYLEKLDLKAFEWVYNLLIFDERDDTDVYYSEWDITSADGDMFKIHGNFYDQIHIIFYDDAARWLYNSSKDVIENGDGWGKLPVTYCGCCINIQYKQIINAIKTNIVEKCRCCRKKNINFQM